MCRVYRYTEGCECCVTGLTGIQRAVSAVCDGFDRYTEGCECCVTGLTGIQRAVSAV